MKTMKARMLRPVRAIVVCATMMAFGACRTTMSDASDPRGCATVTPVSSTEDRAVAAGWKAGTTWATQHGDICRAIAARPPRLVFIGDSITQSFGGDGREVWAPGRAAWGRAFGRWQPVNAGISGDRTQHVLWRLEQGMFDGGVPAAVVLMIGTNNLPDDSSEEIVAGVCAIVDSLRTAHKALTIIVLGVPPRGREPTDPLRVKGARCNEMLAARASRAGVVFADPATALVEPDGRANATRMAEDFTHFSRRAMTRWRS